VLHLTLRKEGKMIKFLTFSVFTLTILIFACSDKKTTTPTGPDDTATSTWIEDGGYWRSLVDATSYDDYVYFSFVDEDTVTLTDEQATDNESWDIAFKRTYIILNGGVSGIKGVSGIDLEAIDSPDGTDFDAVADTSDVDGNSWIEDDYDLVVDEWYSYNPQTHQLTPTNYIYIIKDAEEKYVKFQVIGMEGGGMPPDMGSITCRFVYAAEGYDVSGDPDTVTLEIGTGTGYLDFSTASEVMPADPMTSTDWDIAITSYEIHLNSNHFGPGVATAYPVYQELEDSTDFDEVSDAPTQSQGYFWDELGSILTDWYLYTGPPNHQILSLDHVYLIKSGDTVYKLQIYSYYHPDLGTEGDGWYTFYWAELDL